MVFKRKRGGGDDVIGTITFNGVAYVLRDFEKKPLDPKLRAQTDINEKAMLRNFAKAVALAKRRNVPLREILPVS